MLVHNGFKIRWVLWLLRMTKIITRMTSPLGPTPRSAQKAGSCTDRLSLLRSSPLLCVFNAENSGQRTGHWGGGGGGGEGTKGGGEDHQGMVSTAALPPPPTPNPYHSPHPRHTARIPFISLPSWPHEYKVFSRVLISVKRS